MAEDTPMEGVVLDLHPFLVPQNDLLAEQWEGILNIQRKQRCTVVTAICNFVPFDAISPDLLAMAVYWDTVRTKNKVPVDFIMDCIAQAKGSFHEWGLGKLLACLYVYGIARSCVEEAFDKVVKQLTEMVEYADTLDVIGAQLFSTLDQFTMSKWVPDILQGAIRFRILLKKYAFRVAPPFFKTYKHAEKASRL